VTIASADAAWAYFGCFLNFFDPGNKVEGSQVQAVLAGTHHCIVAEIAYDDAPIINANGVVESPQNSDKLAQRNLQVTASDNPGRADTHRVPQAFDLKPGSATSPDVGQLLEYPDELMIDWGQTPDGSIGHIYWPQISALKVLDLANRLYGTHLLTASDSNTVDCAATRGVTYVPIPAGTSKNIAGLFTVDLPLTVTVGQEFNIIVRRVATRRLDLPVQQMTGERTNDGVTIESELIEPDGTDAAPVVADPESAPPAAGQTPASESVWKPVPENWRQVVGSFQVRIPVTTRDVMLRPDEDALAVLKWRLEQMDSQNRWYPVLQRYITYLSARIAGLGADPHAIPPSPNGAPAPAGGESDVVSFTGRVKTVNYDCFGCFEGFVLEDCCDKRTFATRDQAIAEVVLRACKDHLLLTVYVDRSSGHCIHRLAIQCC